MTPTQIENFTNCMKAIDIRGREEGLTWGELCGYEADEVLHWVIFHNDTRIYHAIIEAGTAIIHENNRRRLQK